MAPVRTGASVRENLSCSLAQTENIVEFAAGQQSAVGRDFGAVKLELEAAVEHQSKRSVLRFTRCRFIRGIHHRPYRVADITEINAYGQWKTQPSGKCGKAGLSLKNSRGLAGVAQAADPA